MPCKFVFICDKTWEELTPTDDPKVKDCDQCGKTVTFCEDFKELTECAKKQKCVCYFNPEAYSSAIHWNKEKNIIEFLHDNPELSQAEKNKITSTCIDELTKHYQLNRKASGDRHAQSDDNGLIQTMGLVTYPEPDPEELERLRNDSNNPFRRKPDDIPDSWLKKLKRFLLRKH